MIKIGSLIARSLLGLTSLWALSDLASPLGRDFFELPALYSTLLIVSFCYFSYCLSVSLGLLKNKPLLISGILMNTAFSITAVIFYHQTEYLFLLAFATVSVLLWLVNYLLLRKSQSTQLP